MRDPRDNRMRRIAYRRGKVNVVQTKTGWDSETVPQFDTEAQRHRENLIEAKAEMTSSAFCK